jgi:hypothetical protein
VEGIGGMKQKRPHNESDSDFMNWIDRFKRSPQKGLTISYYPWNDAYITTSGMQIKLNRYINKE